MLQRYIIYDHYFEETKYCNVIIKQSVYMKYEFKKKKVVDKIN